MEDFAYTKDYSAHLAMQAQKVVEATTQSMKDRQRELTKLFDKAEQNERQRCLKVVRNYQGTIRDHPEPDATLLYIVDELQSGEWIECAE